LPRVVYADSRLSGDVRALPWHPQQLPHTKAEIKAFATSIAALGMLHYRRVVEPEIGPKGKPTDHYLVYRIEIIGSLDF
jgi:hypothetical protein